MKQQNHGLLVPSRSAGMPNGVDVLDLVQACEEGGPWDKLRKIAYEEKYLSEYKCYEIVPPNFFVSKHLLLTV